MLAWKRLEASGLDWLSDGEVASEVNIGSWLRIAPRRGRAIETCAMAILCRRGSSAFQLIRKIGKHSRASRLYGISTWDCWLIHPATRFGSALNESMETRAYGSGNIPAIRTN